MSKLGVLEYGTHFSFMDTFPVIWGICRVIGGMCSEIGGTLSPAQNRGYTFSCSKFRAGGILISSRRKYPIIYGDIHFNTNADVP